LIRNLFPGEGRLPRAQAAADRPGLRRVRKAGFFVPAQRGADAAGAARRPHPMDRSGQRLH